MPAYDVSHTPPSELGIFPSGAEQRHGDFCVSLRILSVQLVFADLEVCFGVMPHGFALMIFGEYIELSEHIIGECQ